MTALKGRQEIFGVRYSKLLLEVELLTVLEVHFALQASRPERNYETRQSPTINGRCLDRRGIADITFQVVKVHYIVAVRSCSEVP